MTAAVLAPSQAKPCWLGLAWLVGARYKARDKASSGLSNLSVRRAESRNNSLTHSGGYKKARILLLPPPKWSNRGKLK